MYAKRTYRYKWALLIQATQARGLQESYKTTKNPSLFYRYIPNIMYNNNILLSLLYSENRSNEFKTKTIIEILN